MTKAEIYAFTGDPAWLPPIKIRARTLAPMTVRDILEACVCEKPYKAAIRLTLTRRRTLYTRRNLPSYHAELLAELALQREVWMSFRMLADDFGGGLTSRLTAQHIATFIDTIF